MPTTKPILGRSVQQASVILIWFSPPWGFMKGTVLYSGIFVKFRESRILG
jgi:hypothetical protein